MKTNYLRIYERGKMIKSCGYLKLDDVLSIERIGEEIVYKKNGVELRRVSEKPALHVDGTIYTQGKSVGPITMEEIGRGSQEPTNQLEVPIYGSGRVGVYYKQENESVYQLSDHLGNVRMTFRVDENGEAIASTKQDYYPFGWKMPGRHQQGSENYRYGYQGEFAEQDNETGWNQFELRMWDGRLGRWMTTDPAGQYFSPYMAMGNDPTSTVDPDGRWGSKKKAIRAAEAMVTQLMMFIKRKACLEGMDFWLLMEVLQIKLQRVQKSHLTIIL